MSQLCPFWKLQVVMFSLWLKEILWSDGLKCPRLVHFRNFQIQWFKKLKIHSISSLVRLAFVLYFVSLSNWKIFAPIISKLKFRPCNRENGIWKSNKFSNISWFSRRTPPSVSWIEEFLNGQAKMIKILEKDWFFLWKSLQNYALFL